MKASQLIDNLRAALSLQGDVNVVFFDDQTEKLLTYPVVGVHPLKFGGGPGGRNLLAIGLSIDPQADIEVQKAP